ncbi:hypothetical protein [Neptunomonas sp.]|uniref:hypothetical protein n=1 Tax=Neptunomonas sp. TaxID=1971898 RepID=UPI0025E71116|nr:hypothetical protein [Neptunomonas sp.]
MNKLSSFLLVLTVALLSGCFSTGNQVTGEQDSSYYLIDTKAGTLCKQSTGFCVQLSLVASQNGVLPAVEKAYQQKISEPNYPRSLMIMLLTPNDKSYQAKNLDTNGRLYRLPRNVKTDTAWKALNELHYATYK